MSVTDDYFALKSNLTETINLAFRQQWIDIPYPQMTLSHKHWDAADLK
jgi:small-conductance mechanosensitive channel